MSGSTSKLSEVFTFDNLFLLLAAGAVAEVILEIIAWWIFPQLLGMPMRPHILVTDVTRNLLGTDLSGTLGGVTIAVSVHMALGVIIFPVIWDLARRMTGIENIMKGAVIYGVILWMIAQMILAPLAGRPFMLGLIPYTWGSLVSHIVYTVAVAWSFERLRGRP